ncbi:MAG: cysteine desulfurase [Erysipelotrichales bacterium]|nr:cysteine desulfurase [Erysipelotrichales bacterium]
MIYFDNAATTSVNSEVLNSFNELCVKYYGNAASNHKYGQDSSRLLNMSREQILKLFNLDNSYQVVFTSGATESNNIAIKGVALAYQNRGKHLITSSVEHPSVLNAFKQLEEEFGFSLTILPVNEQGCVALDTLKNAMRNDTILVSIMHVNNEVGSVNDIEKMSEIIHKYPKCFFHSDTTQGITKLPLNYKVLDMFIASSHKIHGLKGSGMLIIKKNIRPLPLFSGGGQEDNIRSGTNDVPRDVVLAKTLRLEIEKTNKNYQHIKEINNYLKEELKGIEEVVINSPDINASPYILNFSLTKHKASVVVEALSLQNIMVSTISACSSKKNEKSHVLTAMNKGITIASNSIRLSFDENNTINEAKQFIIALKKILNELR